MAALEVIVIKELWTVGDFKRPTLTLASASTAEGITLVTVAKILVVCFVEAPVNAAIVSTSALPLTSVPVIWKVPSVAALEVIVIWELWTVPVFTIVMVCVPVKPAAMAWDATIASSLVFTIVMLCVPVKPAAIAWAATTASSSVALLNGPVEVNAVGEVVPTLPPIVKIPPGVPV